MNWYSSKLLELPIAWFNVKHGISAILKVRSPISDVKHPPLSLLIASVTGSISGRPNLQELSQAEL